MMELGYIKNIGTVSVEGVDFGGKGFYHPPTSFSLSGRCSLDRSIKETDFNDMFVEPKYNVIIEDCNGERLSIPDMKVNATLKVKRRIPRKMKKRLKSKYGDAWMEHHPNISINYTFEKK